jgi:hypothetical protein
MATTTTNFGWDIPQSTDLVKDGATAIAALGQDIDTALIDLKGGTTGQVLAKASGTDLDFSWVAQDDSNAIQNAIVDAKGDLISATANDTPARLAVGTNGHVLTADSTTATGLKWAAAAGGGKVLQVVQGVQNSTTNVVGTAYGDIVEVSITPTSATSKVLIMISNPQRTITASAAFCYGLFKILRGGTALQTDMISTGHVQTAGNFATWSTFNFSYLDAPATTSATIYKLQAKGDAAGTTIQNNYSGLTDGTTIIAMEIGA